MEEVQRAGEAPSCLVKEREPCYNRRVFRETLIKAFPSPDLRCVAANSTANPCDPPEVSKEMLIKSAFP